MTYLSLAQVWGTQHIVLGEVMLYLFLAVFSHGIVNGVMPTVLSCEKGDQAQVRSNVIHTQNEGRGRRFELGEGGGAVALRVTLLSGHAGLPEVAPLSSYRSWGANKSMGIWLGVESAKR